MRQRAAFLHIAKCAGTSVEQALIAATGSPPQPDQQFDGCYVAGLEHPELLGESIRRSVAWDDRPTGVGNYVFHNHWSLPTLRRSFEGADIATVLREPRLRLLSYLEYNRSLHASLHRAWLPDTTAADLARLSMAEALELSAGARATDNLITRQVLWGDQRIPARGFIDPTFTDALATDAIASLEQLGLVALVEDADALWPTLGRWLGAPLTPTHHNRTESAPVPGWFRSDDDVERAVELLRQRSTIDSIVWHHFALRASKPIAGDDAERSVAQRLAALRATAFSATYRSGTAPHRPGALPPTTAAVDAALGDATEVLVLGLAPDQSPTGRRLTAIALPDHPTEADLVIEPIEGLDLRHALVGRTFDAVVLGPDWISLPDPLATLHQLVDELPDETVLVTVASTDSEPHVAGVCAVANWYERSRRTTPDGSLIISRERGADPRCTHYSLPVVEGNTGDSRWLVAQMSAAGRNVLELGCSEGLTTRTMAARGQRVVGVEFDPVAADSAARFAHGMVVADLDSPEALAPLDDRQFDLIVAADVLEHLRFPTATLQRTLRHLAPGGNVLLSIPNLAHADIRMALLDGRVPYAEMGLLDRTHIHWFTHDGVMQMLHDCGLVVTEWQRTIRPPGSADVPFDADMALLNEQLFADDSDATTFQWILRCGRHGEVAEAPDPLPRHNPRRYAHLQATPGIKASAQLLVRALVRRARRGRRRGR